MPDKGLKRGRSVSLASTGHEGFFCFPHLRNTSTCASIMQSNAGLPGKRYTIVCMVGRVLCDGVGDGL